MLYYMRDDFMITFLAMLNECSDPGLSAILKIIKNIMSIIQIVVPILLIVVGTYNLIMLVKNPDDKKLFKKTINSYFAGVIVFFIPTIVNITMQLIDDTFTFSACWNNAGDYNGDLRYISPYEREKKNIYTNPGDYENGVPSQNNNTGIGETIEGTAKQVGDVVWDPSDVTKKSNLTTSQLIAILNAYGGNAKNFIPYASGLITAENKYNVNVFFLLGIEALESGWITSSISRNCNNLGGVRSTSDHPSNGCGRNSGGDFAYFHSVNDFIDYHANMLHKNYLTPGGSYYHGTSPSAVVTNYCPGCSDWPSTVTQIANELFSEVSKVI